MSLRRKEIKDPIPMKRFKCRFDGGVECCIQTTNEAPTNGKSHILSVNWNRKPTMQIIPDYVRWMHSVSQSLSDEWKKTFMYVFPLAGKDKSQVWLYKPGEDPHLVDERPIEQIK